MPTFTVKNVKTFRGNEGTGFDATLYVDGKRVGYVVDSAYGGSYEFHITPEAKKALDEYAASLPVVETDMADQTAAGGKFKYQPDAEHVIDDLVNRYAAERDLKRSLKSKTLFVKESGGIYWMRVPYTHAIGQELRRKWGAGTVILNELPFEQATNRYLEDAKPPA